MVRVYKNKFSFLNQQLNQKTLLMAGALAFTFMANADDPVKFEDTFILRKVARGKINRITADKSLESWIVEAKKESSEKLKEFLASQEVQAAIVASSEAALANLKDEVFVESVLNTLNQVDRKDWLDVFADLQAQMKQKNLSLEDLVRNPQIISDYVATISEKEKAFWKKRTVAKAKTLGAPITETQPEELFPVGSFEDGLLLIKALSSFIKIEVDDDENNLLIREFLKP